MSVRVVLSIQSLLKDNDPSAELIHEEAVGSAPAGLPTARAAFRRARTRPGMDPVKRSTR